MVVELLGPSDVFKGLFDARNLLAFDPLLLLQQKAQYKLMSENYDAELLLLRRRLNCIESSVVIFLVDVEQRRVDFRPAHRLLVELALERRSVQFIPS